ncbi:hypothetical protein ATU3B_00225 [Agrobacterium genomosp. 3 str. CIP 111-78]|uniref:Uncharacterized protein n=1 Tax=Agrobacterium tumefaciens TaxID=358 RepID=A0AAE6BSK5_AGRTU|nr:MULTISPECIES: hypothetical protein [Agrobacterium tumefaciens complex]MCA2370030.1 hypothetical protein [Agrobacterium tomkonis CIP 111-78]QCM03457.1 hypothetical protein CFBP6624_24840 [Agrobacterium tumefaciens]
MSAARSPAFDANAALGMLRERTRIARDAEAEKLFSPDSLNTILSAAAAKGHSEAIFAPSLPMDLSEAEKAKTTKTALETAGFVAEWKVSRVSPDADATTVLRVSWGAAAKPRG